jgi:hypothetical protein
LRRRGGGDEREREQTGKPFHLNASFENARSEDQRVMPREVPSAFREGGASCPVAPGTGKVRRPWPPSPSHVR